MGLYYFKETSLVESSSQLSQIQETSQTQIQQLQAEVLNLKEQLEQHVCNIGLLAYLKLLFLLVDKR